MARKPFEVFEHTADIGIQVYGGSIGEIFINAAQGMESLLVAPEQIRAVTSREITVTGHDAVALLIAWLNELIFLFDTEYLLFRSFDIEAITTTSLRARASGEAYDAQRHELGCAIKAATWHEAAITRNADGSYQARVIFDL